MQTDRMPTIKHVFLEHSEGCVCPICENGIQVCTVCGGSSAENFNTLTTDCYGMPLEAKRIESIVKGDVDFRNGMWVKTNTGPLIVDLMPDLQIGSVVETMHGDCVVFGFYKNGQGHKGIRLIEVCDSATQNPEMFSRIYAETSVVLIPALRELIESSEGDGDGTK